MAFGERTNVQESEGLLVVYKLEGWNVAPDDAKCRVMQPAFGPVSYDEGMHAQLLGRVLT